jgi:hypothetical protein
MYVELTQTGTGIMIGHRAVEIGFDARDTHHFSQKADKFMASLCQIPSHLQSVWVVFKKLDIMGLDGSHARSGRRYDVIEISECLDDLHRQFSRMTEIAIVEGGLTATGLSARHFHGNTGVFQQFHGRKGDRRTVEIR